MITKSRRIVRHIKYNKSQFNKKSAKLPRKYSKSYCIKTPCKKMGFSQKASCRYYKNCYKKSRKCRKIKK